ncbi:hypothetical protein GGI20_000666 [Coemansia sp. BCRC 34301]|nr:hypothetical protein GGI20_000666 [Coemansia sp. BCRC 34301]
MPDNYMLEQQSSYESGSGSSEYPMRVYKHKRSEFRVVVCQVPGPRLVFCGSEKYPYRGYIDAVSSHNLGQPMNASTYDDMTVFKFVGLSQEGAANVLPVALDHIMHPLIQDTHFATEVYHVDQDGRQQGVVLSEMSDFAYRESAVRSLNLRQLIFPPSSTYAWECGGLPQSIASLSIDEIIDYHKEFYSYSNLTLILVGAYDECPAAIFSVLDSLDCEISASQSPLRRPMPPMLPKWRKRRTDYLFASEKSQTGSMTFAWEGPPAEDMETRIALEMLIDYMKADPVSPLRQRFTNRPVPIAGDIDFALRSYIPSAIVLSFTEVSFAGYISHAAAAAATPIKHRSTATSASYPSPTDAFGPLDLTKLHDDVNSLSASNYYRKQLISTLTYFANHWLADHWQHFSNFLAKRSSCMAAKFAEVAMDQKDHRGILYTLTRDAVIHRLSPGSVSLSQPKFGTYGRQFSMRRVLEQKDCCFWKALVQKWFLDGRLMHIATLPDPQMGIQIEAERNLAQRNHIENTRPAELKRIQKRLAKALESTKVNIPRDVLAALPPIPDISQVQLPKFTGYNFNLGNDTLLLQSPFGMGRVLVVPSEIESKLQISFPLAGLSSELWPYLPLFVRLVSAQVGLVIPHSVADTVLQDSCFVSVKPSGMPLVYLNSEQVECAVSESLTEYKACIGDYSSHEISGHWPVEVLTLFGSTRRKNLLRAFKLMSLKMMFGDFGVDTILKVANKLKKELISTRGTGCSLLIDSFSWLRNSGRLDASAIAKYNPLDSTTHATASHPGSESFGRALNLYHQIAFLTAVTKSLSAAMSEDDLVSAETDSVSDAITQIRSHFANCTAATGLAHVALPTCLDRAEARSTLSAIVDEWQVCGSAWRENHQVVTVPATPYEAPIVYNSNSRRIYTPPRKRRKAPVSVPVKVSVQVSPSTRIGSREFTTVSPPLGIHISLASLQTSYVGIQVPLIAERDPSDIQLVPLAKQFEKLPATDIYALQLLCNLFNRSEGLVKNAIRGPGYAYGVGIHVNNTTGNLAVYISHAVDPIKALAAFWEVLEQLRPESGWNEVIDEFQLNAARSIFFLRAYTDIADSLVVDDASTLFRNYSGIEEYLPWVSGHVESITIADLRRVFLKHFVPFITKDAPALYIVATPQYSPETGAEFLQQLNDNAYGAKFKAIDMSVLNPVVTI